MSKLRFFKLGLMPQALFFSANASLELVDRQNILLMDYITVLIVLGINIVILLS